jgi:hypothetical protein
VGVTRNLRCGGEKESIFAEDQIPLIYEAKAGISVVKGAGTAFCTTEDIIKTQLWEDIIGYGYIGEFGNLDLLDDVK